MNTRSKISIKPQKSVLRIALIKNFNQKLYNISDILHLDDIAPSNRKDPNANLKFLPHIKFWRQARITCCN